MNTPEVLTASPTWRRSLLSGAILGAAGLIAAGLGIPALAYLALPPGKSRRPRWADAGDLSKLEPGTPEQVRFRRTRVDGWKISEEKASAWVVKSSDGRLTAFLPQCTHLGCAYHWARQARQFVCPCHGSRFAIDGRVLAGPAPRPLDRYAVKVVGTRVWLGPAGKGGPERS
jgi:menaquinol-cytochrome c reductase iron-sulfur subunit